jgi:hypothetical protein
MLRSCRIVMLSPFGTPFRVAGDRIVQSEPALVDELEDHCAGEGLGDAADSHMLFKSNRCLLRDIPYPQGIGPATDLGCVDGND